GEPGRHPYRSSTPRLLFSATYSSNSWTRSYSSSRCSPTRAKFLAQGDHRLVETFALTRAVASSRVILPEEEAPILGADPHRERLELAGPPGDGEPERQAQL